MDALKKSLAGSGGSGGSSEASAPAAKKPKLRKAAPGQKDMIMAIEGKKLAAKKAAQPERSTRRKADKKAVPESAEGLFPGPLLPLLWLEKRRQSLTQSDAGRSPLYAFQNRV